jgi:hypothetical protein
MMRRVGAVVARASAVLAVGLAVVVGPSVAASARQTQSEEARCDEEGEPTSFLPDGCWGAYPTSKYDIGADPGGFTAFSTRMYGGTTAWYFNFGKGAVQLSLWTVEWAMVGFDIRDYEDVAEGSGQGFNDNLISNARLPFTELAWLVLLGWAGYTALRGRLAMAGSEILLSIVLVGLSAVLMANQETYMESTWDLMDKASTALLAVAHGDDPLDYEGQGGADRAKARRTQAIRELQGGLHEAFVEVPYDYLNWGRSLGDADDPDNDLRTCAAARDEILATGPHGGSPFPRTRMELAGGDCVALASFNEKASSVRMLGALVVLIASVVLGVFLGFSGLTVVVAKLLVVVVFVLAPFAALVAILPGYGRRLAWAWIAALIQLVGAVVVMSFLLSALLLTTDAILGLTSDAPPIERFALLNVLVLTAYISRRRQLLNLQAFAAWFADYMSTVRGAAGSAMGRWRRSDAGGDESDKGLGLLASGGLAALIVTTASGRPSVGAAWLAARASVGSGLAGAAVGPWGLDGGQEDESRGGTPRPVGGGSGGLDLLAIDRVAIDRVGPVTVGAAAGLTVASASTTGSRRIEGDRETYTSTGTLPNLVSPLAFASRTLAERWRENRRIGRAFRNAQRYELWKFRAYPYRVRRVYTPHPPGRPGRDNPLVHRPILLGASAGGFGPRHRPPFFRTPLYYWRLRRRIRRTNRRIRRYQHGFFRPLAWWRWFTAGS